MCLKGLVGSRRARGDTSTEVLPPRCSGKEAPPCLLTMGSAIIPTLPSQQQLTPPWRGWEGSHLKDPTAQTVVHKRMHCDKSIQDSHRVMDSRTRPWKGILGPIYLHLKNQKQTSIMVQALHGGNLPANTTSQMNYLEPVPKY